MSTVSLELEADLVALLHQSNQSVQRAGRECIVLELYRRGTISSGKAAELLGIHGGTSFVTLRILVSRTSH
jgi:predicted HTH domain antitoxin